MTTVLQAIETSPADAEALAAVAWRRHRYLAQRARWRPGVDRAGVEVLSLPTQPQIENTPMAVASLWLDAAETALFAGDHGSAREALTEAVPILHGLGHGFAEALAQLIGVGPLSDRVVLRDEAADDVSRGRAAVAADAVWRAFAADGRARVRSMRDEPGGRSAVRMPVGRSGLPADDVLALARWQHGVDERSPSPHREATAVLQRAIDRQYVALQESRRNRHLWQRLLVPAPLFDLELAVLLAAGRARARSREPSPSDEAVRSLSGELQGFARACMDTVDAIAGQNGEPLTG